MQICAGHCFICFTLRTLLRSAPRFQRQIQQFLAPHVQDCAERHSTLQISRPPDVLVQEHAGRRCIRFIPSELRSLLHLPFLFAYGILQDGI